MADFKAQQRVRLNDGTNDFGFVATNGVFTRITDGTDTLLITAAGDANTVNNNGAGAAAVNIQDGGNSITIDNATLSVVGPGAQAAALRVTIATDISGFMPVSRNTSANSAANPIFVNLTNSTSSDEVQSYNTAAAIASDASSNHSYTVTAGKTLLIKSIIFSASGAGKVELQVGPVATLVSKAVSFISPSHPVTQLFFDPPIEVPDTSTGTARLVRRNDDNQAQDLYSTIVGSEV